MAITDEQAQRLNVALPINNVVKLGNIIKDLQEAADGTDLADTVSDLSDAVNDLVSRVEALESAGSGE